MNAKVLISFLIMIFLLLSGVWISTQWVASLLHYPSQFGTPLFVIGHTPIYAPKFLAWWYLYGKLAPKTFDRAALALYAGVGAFFCATLASAVWRSQKPKKLTSHGTARWANLDDIKKIGLLDNKGVVLGKTDEGYYLRHNGPEHVMLMAPTRAGKGVSIVIPTLLTWPHSVLITDIKSENYGITAGYRKAKLNNKVLKFDPTSLDKSSVRYNPLDEIRLYTKNEVRDVQNITDMIVDPHGKGDLDHWAKTGHALIVGVMLHLKYTLREKATLSAVATFLSNPALNFEQSLILMMQTKHAPDKALFKEIYGFASLNHPVVAQSARELLNKSDRERSSVLSTAMALLELYRDPVVSYNTETSEFSISDLMNYEQPVSLYLLVPPSDINRTRPLIRMILNQVVCRLTESMQFKNGRPVQQYKHRLLLLLDEFPALGRLEAFETSLAFIAGYGITALLVIQSMNQLNKTYFVNNSITDNCHIRVVFTPNDGATPDFISKMLGAKTELVTNQSISGHRFSVWLDKKAISTSQTGRPLLTPGEVLQLPKDREIVFVGGQPPIMANLNFYFRDKNFTKRLLDAPTNSDVLTYKPKDNFLVLDFSLDDAFPGADLEKIKKMPEYKQYFPQGDVMEQVNDLKSFAAAKVTQTDQQISSVEEF